MNRVAISRKRATSVALSFAEPRAWSFQVKEACGRRISSSAGIVPSLRAVNHLGVAGAVAAGGFENVASEGLEAGVDGAGAGEGQAAKRTRMKLPLQRSRERRSVGFFTGHRRYQSEQKKEIGRCSTRGAKVEE